MLTNSDLVEAIEQGDQLHDVLVELNTKYGMGAPVSITWGRALQDDPKLMLLRGTMVCQLQYGQTARQFCVKVAHNSFTVLFAGHQKTVVSDYFLPF